MKWLLNDRRDIVRETLLGVVRASGAAPLALLDGFPEHKVVIRADWQRERVALVSGGGSGHEPAHAGFVGPGMLTAAVAGEVFASPSVDAVFRAIVAVTGPAGCLLIVKNYTGDRLNFGLAAERARSMGLAVEVVIVADDIALPDNPQPRGLAGTLFVHKIAGAAADAGLPLAQVAALAARVAGSTASIGMALESCAMPGGDRARRIADAEVEVGLGIHGEPGLTTAPHASADVLVAALAEQLAATPRRAGQRHALLLNNLGGLTPIEMMVALEALSRTALWATVDLLVGPAPLMTSLDMRGLSLSVLALDEDFARWLTAPSGVPLWPQAVAPRPVEMLALSAPRRPVFAASPGPGEKILPRLLDALETAEPELNALDARSGDGDTGSTIATAARAIRTALPDLPFGVTADLFDALGDRIGRAMGGSSGVLLSIFLAAAANAARSGGDDLAPALLAGLAAMKRHGGADLGHRTMIDALEPALTALAAGAGLAAAAEAAEAGAAATADMHTARAGRASYVAAHHLATHRDPGAEAVAIAFRALANA